MTATTGVLEALAGATSIGVSGGLEPQLRAEIADRHSGSVTMFPVLRGRAVVTADVDRTVVGAPNHLGRIERADDASVSVWWPSLAPRPRAGVVVAMEAASDDDVRSRTRLARYLSRRLRQVGGVSVPWRPETPVLVVMAACDPPKHLALGGGFHGLPGAMRIVVPPGATEESVAAYAATLEGELRRGGDS